MTVIAPYARTARHTTWLLTTSLSLLLAACGNTNTPPTQTTTQETAQQPNLRSQAINPGDNSLLDAPMTASTNGWGPIEMNMSNGESAPRDGHTLSLKGQKFGAGFGVHAGSSMTFDLGGQCQTLTTTIGVDDYVGTRGTVIFQIFGDGNKIYDSGVMRGQDTPKNVSVSVAGVKQLKLVVTDAGDGNAYDHADWAAPMLRSCGTSTTSTGTSGKSLTTLPFASSSNGWGPIEGNMSNGEQLAADGRTITINGKTYATGFGVHASSQMTFNLGGAYQTFTSDIGVDDYVGGNGSVIFQVFADGTKIYDSGVMRGVDAAKSLSVSVAGVNQLRLVVTDAGDGNAYDHADWANPMLYASGSTAPAPAPAPSPSPSPGTVTYAGPITITKGGTYSGNWESQDPNVPAVRVQTSEPVIIENSNIRGKGFLIHGYQNRLTIRNNRFLGLNPNISGRGAGKAIVAEEIYNLRIENNLIENTAGIYLRNWRGNAGNGETIKIFRNKIRNIEGRVSNGSGGWTNQRVITQAIMFNQVQRVPNVEIAWNEIVNEPFKSLPEENINFYISSGTSSSPVRIYNNYIQGAYNADPVHDSNYAGGGILIGDGTTTDPNNSGHVRVFDNQVVGISNHGLAIVGGVNTQFYNNRVIASGRLPDGRRIAAHTVGIYMWDINNQGKYSPATFWDNQMRDNVAAVTVVRSDGSTFQNPWWWGTCNVFNSTCGGNTTSGVATLDLERAEFQSWLSKLSANGVKVGP